MNQYQSFIYAKIQPYMFPMLELRFCKVQELRTLTNNAGKQYKDVTCINLCNQDLHCLSFCLNSG